MSRNALFALSILACVGAPLAAQAQSVEEIALYQALKESNDPTELQIYLNSYPKGVFAPIFEKRLARINEAVAQSVEKKATEAKIADAPDPTIDEVKAMLASYYANERAYGGKILGATYREIKVHPKEIMSLSQAHYPEYGRRGVDINVPSWKVHIVIDVEVDSILGRNVAHENRELRMLKNERNEWVYRWI